MSKGNSLSKNLDRNPGVLPITDYTGMLAPGYLFQTIRKIKGSDIIS